MEKDSFYKPTGNVKDSSRTYVPELYREVAAELQAEEAGQGNGESSRIVKLQRRPVIGVLYSISAGMEGELFPVYVGRNIIGSDLSCDICLRETSVSAEHGILLARKQTNFDGEEYVNVSLSDNNTAYGTTLNGDRLSFDKVTCEDGDILGIGLNYVLILSLFNAIDKLTVSPAFDRIPEPKQPVENKPTAMANPAFAMPQAPIDTPSDHSTNITNDDHLDEASVDFYKPTKQKEPNDHYNNETIIL